MSIPNMLSALVDDNKIEGKCIQIGHRTESWKCIGPQKSSSCQLSSYTAHVPQEVDTEGEDV